jgi:hypothetical protein
VIAICIVLVLLGVAAVGRWGAWTAGHAPAGPDGVGWRLRVAVATLAVCLVTGTVAGAIAAGAGGRLAMRLLAITSPPEADLRITEAGEVIGRITTEGTLGFIAFASVFAGFAAGLLYAVLRRWLPAGRARGAVFAALVLVVAGTRIEPLRSDNFDFVLVSPAWLAVVVFSAVVVFDGLLVSALAERALAALPARWRPATRALRPRPLRAGRLVLGLVFVVALPGFVTALGEILG